MYAKLILVGNLGRDPEMRYTADGTPVTNFSVAVNRKWNNPDGSQGSETTWFKCTAWRGTAEVVNQYLKKGATVLVEGRLNPGTDGSPKTWTGNDGVTRASYDVTAETVKFLDKRADNSAPPQQEDPIPF